MSITQQKDRLEQVQSLVRAFSILDALRDAEGGMTLTEVANVARLPRSTTHRLLATMNSLKYVEFDSATNRWMVGLQAFSLGASFMQTRDLGRLGRPIMRSLMIDAGETVNIGLASPEGLSYIAQMRPVHAQGVAVPVGALMPLHTTASGKALLAYNDGNVLEAYLAERSRAPETGVSCLRPDAFANELDQVRQLGYAVDDQEHRAGLCCVAAPVFDRNGTARLSLSISGSIYRFPPSRMAKLGKLLTGAAERMTSEIGGLLAA